jgi:hypothetical protein
MGSTYGYAGVYFNKSPALQQNQIFLTNIHVLVTASALMAYSQLPWKVFSAGGLPSQHRFKSITF